MEKFKSVLSITVAVIIVIMTLFLCISVGEKIVFAKFFSRAKKEFKIPGLFTGYTPQGFDYLESENTFVLAGYDKKDHTPIVYLVKENEKDAVRVEFFDKNGEKFESHAGGISHYGDYFYMTNEMGVDIFRLSDVLDGDGKAERIGRIDTSNIELRASCCSVYDGFLYVGEFYIKKDYETPESHRIGENTALMGVYRLADDGNVVSETPVALYSIRGQVQGMCILENGNIALSTSYGLAKSRIFIYDITKVYSQKNEKIEINGVKTNFYVLDESSQIEKITAPPMAEEIVPKDGKLYILTESACMKYLFGKITSGNYVYSFKLK